MKEHFSPISLGHRIRCRSSGGFVWTETVHSPSLKLKGHSHEFSNFVFVIRGSVTETIRGRSHECDPFSLLIKPGGELHSDHYGSSGACCLITEILPQRRSSIQSRSGILDCVAYIPKGRMSALALQLYREFKTEDTASELAMEALTLELLAGAIRDSDMSHSRQPSWLHQAREFLHDRFREPISLSAIARDVGVHPAYLARTFRKKYHCTVGEYVRRLRLDFAVRELSDSEKSLAEIASGAGFYDQSHFTNAFRNQLHMTPSEFRSQVRKPYPKK